jgi:hypothetical protein
MEARQCLAGFSLQFKSKLVIVVPLIQHWGALQVYFIVPNFAKLILAANTLSETLLLEHVGRKLRLIHIARMVEYLTQEMRQMDLLKVTNLLLIPDHSLAQHTQIKTL